VTHSTSDAKPVLAEIFNTAAARGQIDELGNGRFARSLFERACAARTCGWRISTRNRATPTSPSCPRPTCAVQFRELGGPQPG